VIENKSLVQPIITISTVNYTHIYIVTMTTVKEKDYDGKLR
jgi:hypothetical protein